MLFSLSKHLGVELQGHMREKSGTVFSKATVLFDIPTRILFLSFQYALECTYLTMLARIVSVVFNKGRKNRIPILVL